MWLRGVPWLLWPPVTVPVNVGSAHVYNVFDGTMFPPATPAAGDTWNCTPLQVTVDSVTNSGVGLTDTTTVNAAPVQFADKVLGVTI
jgi:hypothetical protein